MDCVGARNGLRQKDDSQSAARWNQQECCDESNMLQYGGDVTYVIFQIDGHAVVFENIVN
jgi:hypothetical protein